MNNGWFLPMLHGHCVVMQFSFEKCIALPHNNKQTETTWIRSKSEKSGNWFVYHNANIRQNMTIHVHFVARDLRSSCLFFRSIIHGNTSWMSFLGLKNCLIFWYFCILAKSFVLVGNRYTERNVHKFNFVFAFGFLPPYFYMKGRYLNHGYCLLFS